MRQDNEQRLQLSSEIIVEGSRFVEKLRDLFGLTASGKKLKVKGPEGRDPGETASVAISLSKGGKKGAGGKREGKEVKAAYLDDASRHLINKRQQHDDLLKSLSRGVDAFAEALRQKDHTIDDLQVRMYALLC